MRPLVLPADAAADLNPPGLRSARRVAERLERDRDLGRPSSFEPAGPHVPDLIPVAVRVALVRVGLIGERAQRSRIEDERVPPIVVGVEAHAEVVVVAQALRIAAHVVGDPLLRRRAVPAAAHHIEVVIVVQHPRFGAFRRRRARRRKRLDEVADRRHGLVDLFVQPAVDAERHRDPRGADDDAVFFGPREDVGLVLCGGRVGRKQDDSRERRRSALRARASSREPPRFRYLRPMSDRSAAAMVWSASTFRTKPALTFRSVTSRTAATYPAWVGYKLATVAWSNGSCDP